MGNTNTFAGRTIRIVYSAVTGCWTVEARDAAGSTTHGIRKQKTLKMAIRKWRQFARECQK